MPALSSSALLSWSELDFPRRDRCPVCHVQVPAWQWTRVDDLRVLTHDGNVICPKDPTFGYQPVTSSSAVVISAVPDACRDCDGSLTTSDDGSLTGFHGELVPCGCVVFNGSRCSCEVIGWPLNDGFTGWIELTRTELHAAPEDAPVYRPCPHHNAAGRPVARTAVAA
ncbi:hypothetical protein NX801_27390 [Streptomyces sp. LP05-1]|uniref:Uncharacterized protein n=1 Tax=Streptomyces pyxinae TaxID=2970734 RepID=A0ABT2CPD1_9ACTN|nr:hypothetical protein [Streptomyces sp. LP05-1]MCS0639296.1 hypothetical protein [Streptomyces sp. LP05-1]